jgi:hypothetical protein
MHWHPYLWSDQKRFAFLCAVANEEEVAKAKGEDKGLAIGVEKGKKKPTPPPSCLPLSLPVF